MDRDHIARLVEEGSTNRGVAEAQRLAKRVMDENGYGSTLHNACAATLSEFMALAGIDVPVTLGAGRLASRIRDRGWNRIAVGNQFGGDVAVAENDVHIFLVVQAIDKDIMIIADNQAPGPHRRKASGEPKLNHSPVAYFLRAEGVKEPMAVPEGKYWSTALPDPKLFPQSDEPTKELKEPFDDNGKSIR